MSLQKLPVTILTCETLVVLKLVGFRVEDDEAYSCVVLPSLKTLIFKYIGFPKLRDFLMFLSGCPILEVLLTLHVSFVSNESLTCIEWNSFCLNNLNKADINSAYCYIPLKPFRNVTSLRFEIDKVNFRDDFDFIPTFHNLTQLKLISLDYTWSFLLQLLNHCPKLQRLDVDQADTDKRTWGRQDYKEYWVDPAVVPQCLSLHLRTCNLFNFLGLRVSTMQLLYLVGLNLNFDGDEICPHEPSALPYCYHELIV
ncbi:FBD-associated F-box protein At5g60610-like [Vicia villosa]|uniref:FBD-associated F-box protein At5g60610-like n=1 Tax=Vicia villosa TaxID=3911 RepID=UPI00273CAEF9|nr:FBD-associated F-box protein At5g60610-like [Vicia villosa]